MILAESHAIDATVVRRRLPYFGLRSLQSEVFLVPTTRELTKYQRVLLEQIAIAPDTAVVPLKVAAAHEGKSAKQLRGELEDAGALIRLSSHRYGCTVKYLRDRRQQTEHAR